MRLTETAVKNAKGKEKAYKLADHKQLYLYVSVTGGKAWRLDAAINGKRATLTLGRYPDMSLKQARQAAADARELIAQGIDPREEKKRIEAEQTAEEQRRAFTFKVVAENWLDYWKNSVTQKTALDAERRLNKYAVPAIGSKPFDEITRADYAAIVTKLPGETPKSTAYKMAFIFSAIEKYAIDMCNHGGNRAEGLTRLLQGQAYKVQRHPAITTLPELKEALTVIELFFMGGASGPHVRYALKLVPLTGLRISKLTELKWEYLDLDAAMLHLPAGYDKNRMPQDLPLARQTAALFRDLKMFSSGSEYVFPSRAAKEGHITENGVLVAAKKIIDPEVCKLHGWRATFLTFTQENGLPRKIADELLSHKQGNAVTLAYDRAAYAEQKRQLVQWYADFLDAVRTGKATPPLPEGLKGLYQY